MDEDYPEAVWVPLIPVGTFVRHALADLNGHLRSTQTGKIGIDRCPQTITNIDSLAVLSAANDTDFDQTYQWVPEASGKIDKFFVNIAGLMHIDSIDGGSGQFQSIRLTITREGGDDLLFDQAYMSGIAARTGDEDLDLFIVQEPVWGADMKIRAGNPLNIRVRMTVAQTATVVTDVGLVPFFTQQIGSTTGEVMFWGHSGIMWYIPRDQPF